MRKRTILVLAVVALVFLMLFLVTRTREEPESATRIGAILPLTGDYGAYGKRSLKALRLGLQDGGLIENKTYLLTPEDDVAEVKNSLAAVNKLMSLDKAEFIVGPFPSGCTIAVAEKIKERPVILLSPASTAPSISGIAANVFRTCPSDTMEAEVVARAMLDQKKLRAAVLVIQNEYGAQLTQAFSKTYSGNGGTVVLSDTFPAGTRDFRVLTRRVLQSEAEVVYLVGYDELQGLIRAFVERGQDKRLELFTNIMINNPRILNALKECAPCKAWRISYPVWTTDNPAQMAAVKDLEKRLGEQSDPFAVNSYNAGRVIAAIVKSPDGQTFETRLKILKGKQFEGLTGSISFDQNGDVVLPVHLREVYR